jgi:hypothetical protein
LNYFSKPSGGFTESVLGPAATSPRHPIKRPVRAQARRVRSLARPRIGAHRFEPGGELERELPPGEEEMRGEPAGAQLAGAQLAGVEGVGAVAWSRRLMSAHSAHTDSGTSPKRMSSPKILQPRQ